MTPHTFNLLRRFEQTLNVDWDLSESARDLLASRVPEEERCFTGPVWVRTGKGYYEAKFFGTFGYSSWYWSLNGLYEGEIDCDTWGTSNPIPLGYGRLILQDTRKNTAFNSYVGYFDGNIKPSIYQYDRVLLR